MDKVTELEKLVRVQKQYRVDAHQSFCEDVANSLRPEFKDFLETKDMPMNEMLGEIYRAKLETIMKTLNAKGINI